MVSNPPGRCCAVGIKHEGEAHGEIKKIGDVRTYFAYPENKATQNAIIILTDVFGVDFINVQLVADQFAANGYFTVIPDLFNGDVAPLNPPADFDIMGIVKRAAPNADAIAEATIKHLRGELGVKRLGGVGYCFGAKYVVRWLKEGGFDVGYLAHPSFVDKEELEAIKRPLSIAAAETDHVFPASKRHESEEILQKLSVPYQINLFSDVAHGFAMRGDLSKKPVKFAKEQAFLQAVVWFDEYLKQ
ncbi:dienelactone hydrolase [Bimuria novae-zelandiae CBS 107.79]|uniref:Dienelactone hydrolase n=1 Tax=Bimuria novae-zelandiae CBS 107.79 TaxID=1447943 RepID=A0A6A5VX42_9PLEO|nr:dienelactone hydrolase [Bimuria novae-zelandiae CBS 107.79]